MPFVALEKLHQLYDGYRQVVNLAGQSFLLLHENGKTHLIRNRCPHAGAPLTQATLSGNSLRCPMHGLAFDLNTGLSTSPACAQRLEFIPLVYDGNRVGIEWD